MNFAFRPLVPLQALSAIREAEQKQSVTEGSPLALHCELSDANGQIKWYKDETRLLPQTGIDIRSKGHLRSLVSPSTQVAHSGVNPCESKDDNVQFAVEVKGDAYTSLSSFCTAN